MRWVRYWKPALFVAAVLAGFLYGRCGGDSKPVTPGVTDNVMVEKPAADPPWRERIVYRPVEVERRITVERVDTLIVQEFVEAAQNPDSLPPTHLPYAVEFDGETLLMWGIMSNGDRTYSEHDIRAKFRAGWEADSTWAREQRLARFPIKRVAFGTALVAGIAILVIVR